MRLAFSLVAMVPAVGAMALDPTLPQPGRTRPPAAAPAGAPASTPTAQDAAPAGDPAQTPAAPVPAPAPANRQPIPDAKALSEAQALVGQVYGDELNAARTPELKKQLATKLRQLAGQSRPPGMYVLLGRARELSADAGDINGAFGCVADLERAFLVDGAAMDLDSVSRLLRVVRTVEGYRSITRHLLGSANQAVADNRFESARKLIDQGVQLSARASDPPTARLVSARSKEVREIEAAYQQAKPALDAVAAKSPDAAQNLAAGRYLALYQGDFAAGLPLLAAGSDDPLKEVAAKEVAGVSGADQQDALADAWWAIAEKLSGVAKNQALIHAGRFYADAAASLTGLQQAKAVKRAKETELLAMMYAGRSTSSAGTAATVADAATPGAAAAPDANHSSAKPAATTPTATPAANINLPGKFVRIWKSPEAWTNKPEEVLFKAGRVTITNAGGTVCENEPLVAQKDGSLALTWDYGPDKTGYELWSIKDGELVINRWNSKSELESGRPVRRVGTISR